MDQEYVLKYLRKKLNFSEKSIKKLHIFSQYLIKFNSKYNLIAKSTEKTLWTRHILDSAQIIKFIENKKDLKIIDFGSSFLEKSHYTNFYIQSRYYRAPEVIYKINIGKEIDIWSYGCIIYELYVCYPLFNAKNENLLLHKFAEKIGIPYDDLDYYNTEIFHNNFIFSSKEKAKRRQGRGRKKRV